MLATTPLAATALQQFKMKPTRVKSKVRWHSLPPDSLKISLKAQAPWTLPRQLKLAKAVQLTVRVPSLAISPSIQSRTYKRVRRRNETLWHRSSSVSQFWSLVSLPFVCQSS